MPSARPVPLSQIWSQFPFQEIALRRWRHGNVGSLQLASFGSGRYRLSDEAWGGQSAAPWHAGDRFRHNQTFAQARTNDVFWSRTALPIGSYGVVRMRPLPAFRGASRTQIYMSLSTGAYPPLTAESGHCRRGFCSWTAPGRGWPTSICSSPAFGFHLVLDAPRDTPVGRLQAYAVPAG